ncbi:DNA gyrase inhibitor YacG [Salinisphaera sp. SPP-AMP-43]|uniref:DNA gyrase inhibitor YacG n=1 Tax=Salinisphaera sp. SPP-AMP-43 TaxID=3121288 RepID=UPI003C6DF839
MSSKPTAPCPQCGEPSDMSPNNRYRPFCSRRCKLIDLGDWLDESHRIPDPSGSAGTPNWADGDDEPTH